MRACDRALRGCAGGHQGCQWVVQGFPGSCVRRMFGCYGAGHGRQVRRSVDPAKPTEILFRNWRYWLEVLIVIRLIVISLTQRLCDRRRIKNPFTLNKGRTRKRFFSLIFAAALREQQITFPWNSHGNEVAFVFAFSQCDCSLTCFCA